MATLRGCALGNSSHQRAAGDGEAGDLGRDVDARGGYRIAELHGVLTSTANRPRSDSSRSMASTPPPTALAAARLSSTSSSLRGQSLATPPRAVLVIQCS